MRFRYCSYCSFYREVYMVLLPGIAITPVYPTRTTSQSNLKRSYSELFWAGYALQWKVILAKTHLSPPNVAMIATMLHAT